MSPTIKYKGPQKQGSFWTICHSLANDRTHSFHPCPLFVIALLLVFSSCRHTESNINIFRYDSLLFETPTEQLHSSLSEANRQYGNPLLHIYPDDPTFMEMLSGYVADSTMRQVYNITRHRYPSLVWLEKELSEALGKAAKLDSEIGLDHASTFLSGTFDYDSRVVVDAQSRSLLVSLDQYALPQMERFGYFGLPMYLVNLCDSAYMVSDIMAELARQYIVMPNPEDITLLDLMLMEGKVLYFLDQVMPNTDDNLKIRYSDEQFDWCRRNEAMIWAYLIQHNMLYEKDKSRFHNFIDEAPKTNAFKDSAPRTPQYIGWHIIRNYMNNNKCSIKELFENTDSQAILSASKYKP